MGADECDATASCMWAVPLLLARDGHLDVAGDFPAMRGKRKFGKRCSRASALVPGCRACLRI